MEKRAQPGVVAAIVIGGLFSGLACQAHMVAEAGAAHSHHAARRSAHDHNAGTFPYRASHDDEGAPPDPCCIVQVADFNTLKSVVTLPVFATAVAIMEEPTHGLADPGHLITTKPPGERSILHQTSVLLI